MNIFFEQDASVKVYFYEQIVEMNKNNGSGVRFPLLASNCNACTDRTSQETSYRLDVNKFSRAEEYIIAKR